MRTAGNIALTALCIAGFLNLGELLFDPDGTWWLVVRMVAAAAFTVAAVVWLVLWLAHRRRRNS